ncbi:MAG TPA: hypothetical protein VKA67_01850, partial [Verrucomicrobiae bacterium]|nr:hypothetical protein [Verrucomicrobiae bacterium]
KYKGRPHRRDGFSAVIVRKSWDAIRRLIRNCERDLIFECADLKERTNCAAVLVRVPRGDDIHVTHAAVDSASFPNFRKVIPKYKAGDSEAITYCVNPKLLEELLAAVREAGTDEENKAVKLVIPRDSSKPMIVWGHNGAGVSVTGVLMPVLMRAYGGK